MSEKSNTSGQFVAKFLTRPTSLKTLPSPFLGFVIKPKNKTGLPYYKI